VSDGPKHGRPIQLVERISCINEQKSPLFFLFVLPPQLVDGMDAAFDASFEASAELVNAASLFGIAARDKKSGLGGKPPPGLANSNGTYARALVESD
jgi:hypothetical protein